jgi:hypothetical protein
LPDRWAYLCIMKGRQAEYTALTELDADASARVTPLIQLWPGPATEATNGNPQQPLWNGGDAGAVWNNLRAQLLAKMKDRWPPVRPVLLDGDWMRDAAAFRDVLDNCRAFGRKPIPVTGLGRTLEYQEVVAAAIAADHEGVVLRLGRDDFPPEQADLTRRVELLLARLNVLPREVDLVLDLRHVERQYWERDELLAASMIHSLPRLEEWRNVAVASTGMPPNARGFATNEIEPFPRLEWWIRQRLEELAAQISRRPVHGDYGVIHPDRVEEVAEMKKLPRIPQIRYTTANFCLMVRGKDLNEESPEHLAPLFKRLMDREEWCGPAFSEGDRWMADVAAGSENVGNYMTWKKHSQVHHLTFVSQQLASRFDL